jgi:hypothetical protein
MTYHKDAKDIVDVDYDELVHDTGKAILVKVDGSDSATPIGYNAPIENLEELQEKFAHGDNGKGTIQVPKWLAVDNGWDEWDED